MNGKNINQLPPKMENPVLCQKVMEKMHLKPVFTYLTQIQDYTFRIEN